jgi:hypothetical protein
VSLEILHRPSQDPGEMVLNCLQVEVRIMTAGKVLQIG